MRKYENVDIVAVLGTIVELNTEHYKSDFKYDIERFKEAAKQPDAEKQYLWLSGQSGTWCVSEREAHIKDCEAFSIWTSCAVIHKLSPIHDTAHVSGRIFAFAVEVKGLERGRVMGDLHELDYGEHVRQLWKNALPVDMVDVKFWDGSEIHLPYDEYYGKRRRLYEKHGEETAYRMNPKSEAGLQALLEETKTRREKDSKPADFKLRIQGKRTPSIKQQLVASKENPSPEKSVSKSADKRKCQGLEV